MIAVSSSDVGTEKVERKCRILILCEDFAAYERAVEHCWRTLMQLADDLDFSFNCWNFYELSDPACTRSIINSAKTSDLILFSLQQPHLPEVAENWLEELASQRLQTDGVLALVLNESACSPEAVARLGERLEMYVRMLGMDFSPHVQLPRGFTCSTGTTGS